MALSGEIHARLRENAVDLARGDLQPIQDAAARHGVTIVIGIKKIIDVHDALTEWSVAMATAVLAMLPPVAVVVLLQRLFVKGLIETEK